ncbi:MAG TPA: YciI family protein [Chitinophagaceae bacterium]|nr:YciI family protein [Chitinophagaceae bacterium]
MKKRIIICTVSFLLGISISALSQQDLNKDKLMQIRQYWFVLLTKGPSRSQDSATAAKIQKGHLANIMRLYKEGKIKVAGPFGEDGDWQGIFIFDCEKKEEVEQLLKTDPAISAGRLNFEIHSWWTAPMGSFVPGKPKID